MNDNEARGQAADVMPQAAGGEIFPAPDGGAAHGVDGAAAGPARTSMVDPARRAFPDGAAARRGTRRRRWLAAGLVLLLAGTGAAAAGVTGRFGAHSPTTVGSEYMTSTAVVTRQSLTSQTQVDGTLGDAGSWSVVVPPSGSSSGSSSNSGSGSQTFTWLPAAGQTILQGQVIYTVSGSPVVLLYGQIPAYRTLSEGATGADVTQLNHDLVQLGYASSAGIAGQGWDSYSWDTNHALGLLQAHLGISDPSGALTLGTAVFLPGPALITALGSSVVLGGAANSGTVVATASSTTPVVTIDLDASLQSYVHDGDPVTITLPDGTSTPGAISQISKAASSNSNSNSSNSSNNSDNGSSDNSDSSTITVLASLDHPSAAGSLNSAPVTVTITTASVSSAVVVPVNALLAQPDGYAVEVVGTAGSRHLVAVTPGLFDDAAGLVQVTGNVTPGQRVVVPAS